MKKVLIFGCLALSVSITFGQAGANDPLFAPGSGADAHFWTTMIQPDGKILIGGTFTTCADLSRRHIARFNADGSLDTGFDPGTGAVGVGDDDIYSIAILPDGKLVVGGDFITFDGTPRNYIVKLNSDGSVDPAFDPGEGANDWVRSVILVDDGKLVIGGDFTTYDGVPRNRIARINSDGSLDPTFDPGAGSDGAIIHMVVLPDGKILAGGLFTTYDGVSRKTIVRVDSDGSLDTSFDPGTGGTSSVRNIALQMDGKAILTGPFLNFNGTGRNYVIRLNTDGGVDDSFASGAGPNQAAYGSVVQSDGKVVVVGAFTQFDGVDRKRIVRLDSDGSIDPGFDPGVGANSIIWNIALQTDGKMPIGGQFTTYAGAARNHIARVLGDGNAGIQHAEPEVTLHFAPDPAHDILRITGVDRATGWSVKDLQGRELLQGDAVQADELVIDVSHLSTGSYLFVVRDGQFDRTARFAKL